MAEEGEEKVESLDPTDGPPPQYLGRFEDGKLFVRKNKQILVYCPPEEGSVTEFRDALVHEMTAHEFIVPDLALPVESIIPTRSRSRTGVQILATESHCASRDCKYVRPRSERRERGRPRNKKKREGPDRDVERRLKKDLQAGEEFCSWCGGFVEDCELDGWPCWYDPYEDDGSDYGSDYWSDYWSDEDDHCWFY